MSDVHAVTPPSVQPATAGGVRAVDAVANAEAMMSERLRVTSELVAGLLHEFNTPLGALRASIHTAREHLRRAAGDPAALLALTARLDAVLSVAAGATEKIVDTVGTLDHFARVDRADVAEIDVLELVYTAVRLAGVPRRQLDVRAALADRPRVRCRVREMEHVLYHVIRNAEAALGTRTDARLEISVEREERAVVAISVSDNGPGIAEEQLAALFDAPTTANAPMLGLGLTLPTCRVLAEAHGGSLEVANRSTGGLTVTLRFCEATC